VIVLNNNTKRLFPRFSILISTRVPEPILMTCLSSDYS